MAKLVLSTEGSVIDEYPVTEENVTIGRIPDNTIHIDSMAISTHHAKIVTILTTSFIEDMNSTNGTFVNSEQISKSMLKDGDVITLGTHNLKFVATLEAPKIGDDSHESTQGNINGKVAHLDIVSGNHVGKAIPLEGKMTTVGRVGEHVAAVTKRGNQYYLSHIDGGEQQQPSILNGEAVSGSGAPLKSHDILEIAGIKMEFVA
ncbi:MAG TPA: FHA domain-containing protein [Gammaproteobacteria bacterium]|nr:FHA domain-containing protein [Gammaproteobacteria bacterium]